MKKYILNGTWYKVYEYLEFTLRNLPNFDDFNHEEFIEYLKEVLQHCNSGYTIIQDKFVPNYQRKQKLVN